MAREQAESAMSRTSSNAAVLPPFFIDLNHDALEGGNTLWGGVDGGDLRAARDIGPGEEITDCYGAPSIAELFYVHPCMLDRLCYCATMLHYTAMIRTVP